MAVVDVADVGSNRSPGSVLEEVVRLTPLIQGARTGSEERYRMAPEVFEELGALQVFRMTVPAAHGGPGLALPDVVRVHEQLAYGDPSVAWAAGNSNGVGGLLGRMDPATIPELLDPGIRFYGVGLATTGRAEEVEGGYRVSGRWPVVSGSLDAGWFALHCLVHAGGLPKRGPAGPEARFVFVPAAEVTVEDTWRGVVAVRGSGSNAVAVTDVFVPAARTVARTAPAHAASPADAIPPAAVGSVVLAAIATGIARAGVDAAIAQASSRVSIVTGTGWAEWPAVQNSVASADIAVHATRSALLDVVDQAWDEARAGALTPVTHARMHSVTDHAFRAGRQAVSDLFTAGSVDALRAGHGLEQALRDIHGFSVQWERYRRYHFEAGRVLMGATPNDPSF